MPMFVSTRGSSSFLAPKLLALFLVFFMAVPLRIPGISPVFPMLDIMVVFFWAVYRPHVMPHWFIFILGIIQDAMLGMPLGVTSFLNLMLWLAAVAQRRLFVNEAFAIVWSVFFLLSLAIVCIKWLLLMLLAQEFISPTLLAIQWILTFLAYPAIHWLNNLICEKLPDHQ